MMDILWLLLANLVILIHLAFILFAVFGGGLVLKNPRLALLHLPAVVWGGLVEIGGYVCPLTPLENYFRRMGGEAAYSGDFLERYLLPLIYPSTLTRDTQIALGLFVLILNFLIYALLALRHYRKRR